MSLYISTSLHRAMSLTKALQHRRIVQMEHARKVLNVKELNNSIVQSFLL